MLRKHVGLNYSFTLTQFSIIDSARVGNETRYINHGSNEDGTANAAARSALLWNNIPMCCHLFSDPAMLVLGEPRIALYSSMWTLSLKLSFSSRPAHSARYQGGWGDFVRLWRKLLEFVNL